MSKLSLLACMFLTLAVPIREAPAIELSSAVGARLVVPVKSWKETRFNATVRQQYDFSCGSAALATLLSHHYGYRVTEQMVFEQMYVKGDQQKIRQQGFSLLDMQGFLAGHGFRADGFELPLEKLVEAKLPAIVLVSDKGYNHFVVIKGVAGGRILIGDPSSGTRTIGLERFSELWSNKLLFVIHGYDGAVAFNREADWRAVPQAPLEQGIARNTFDAVSIPKFGPGDF
ncbi:MAG: peptidase [Massilia sp.]|jgi:predicted double-glycine peptidase|nr:peptidase [Massilia sp.]